MSCFGEHFCRTPWSKAEAGRWRFDHVLSMDPGSDMLTIPFRLAPARNACMQRPLDERAEQPAPSTAVYLWKGEREEGGLLLIPKTIGNRKRDCAWGCSGWLTLPEKIYRSQSTNQSAKLNERLPDLCFAICRFSQVRFITPSHLTHNLFFYFQ